MLELIETFFCFDLFYFSCHDKLELVLCFKVNGPARCLERLHISTTAVSSGTSVFCVIHFIFFSNALDCGRKNVLHCVLLLTLENHTLQTILKETSFHTSQDNMATTLWKPESLNRLETSLV